MKDAVARRALARLHFLPSGRVYVRINEAIQNMANAFKGWYCGWVSWKPMFSPIVVVVKSAVTPRKEMMKGNHLQFDLLEMCKPLFPLLGCFEGSALLF